VKHTYTVRIQPQRHHLLASMAPLSNESLANAIEGAIVHSIVPGDRGGHDLHVQLQRPTHEEALNDLLVAVQRFGYSWVEATVTEWADNMLAGFLLGGLGGGTAGASSGDGGTSLALAAIGSVVGAVIGSFIDSVKVVYAVHWNGMGWQLVELAPVPAAPATRPQLA
jgi:hypothetical protein